MNKQYIVLMAIICLGILLISSCTAKEGSRPYTPAVPEAAPTPSIAEKADSAREFSIVAGGGSIALQDWDNEADMSFLGTPVSEEIKILDQSADTFAGSYIKNVKYAGIELELFSPKDNGESFWVKEIIITTSSFLSPRGVGVNNSLKELNKKYPEIEQVPDGRTSSDNCAYIYRSIDGLSNIVFEVKNGEIISIRIYQELP